MRRIAGAAALIAVLTVAARLVGFGRTVVFAWAVGPTDLGDIYLAANTVPNIIFEIVAGGALASLVVPLLAPAVDRGDRATVNQTTSALLTWTLAILLPAALLVWALADPIIRLLAGDASPAELAAGARMLRVFAPQLPLYGVGIVLTGVLQAHHRFAWPVLAPLLSSVTVVGTYLTFVVVEGRGAGLAAVGRTGEMILSVGTTLGVAVLSLCLLIPMRGLTVRAWPSVAFPEHARRLLGGLALAGAVTVAGQQLALVVLLRFALTGPEGTVVLFTLAQTLYLVPWAVLAVPIAVAAYPVLSAAGRDDPVRYRTTLAPAVRGAFLLSCLGAAALVALARPGAELLTAVMPAAPPAGDLAGAIAGFAPGLVGYGLFAVLSRALYARGDTRVAAAVTAVGWATVAGAAAALSATLPTERRAAALGLANSAGMTVLGVGLLIAAATRAGRETLAGLARAGTAGLLGGAAAAGLGTLVVAGSAPALGSQAPGTPGVAGWVVPGMLSGGTVLAVFLAIVYAIDRRDLTPMLAGVRRRLARRSAQRERGPVTR